MQSVDFCRNKIIEVLRDDFNEAPKAFTYIFRRSDGGAPPFGQPPFGTDLLQRQRGILPFHGVPYGAFASQRPL